MLEVELDDNHLTLRRYLNCFDQEDLKLIETMKEHYIRKVTPINKTSLKKHICKTFLYIQAVVIKYIAGIDHSMDE